MTQGSPGLNAGGCWYCGKYTETRYSIGWRVQRAPFCGFPHAGAWRKRQGIPSTTRIVIAPRK